MKVTLWGTRGSIPTPSARHFQTVLFGGDTTCVSVQNGELLLIFDAGSGIRYLGAEMLRQGGALRASLFFTHVHWDHIQGFPFFAPAFDSRAQLDLYGPGEAELPGDGSLSFRPADGESLLKKAILGQQQALYFPVDLSTMATRMRFFEVDPKEKVQIDGKTTRLEVSCQKLNHPGGCLGYRVEEISKENGKRRVFCFLTDTEHPSAGLQPAVQELAHEADLMIYDAQYTEEEYAEHKGWGHSTWNHGLREAEAAGAARVVFSHHDPMHDDSFLLRLEKEAQHAAASLNLEASFARQFESFDLS